MTSWAHLPSTFTTRSALGVGLHPRDLYRLRDAGEILEMSRGVFRRADAPAASWPDLLAVTMRAPRSIACCVTAAVVHDLTDEMPGEVQVAVSTGSAVPRISHPPVRILQFAPSTFDLGLTSVEAAPGESVRIYDQPRTAVDLVRLRHRFGEQVAYGALHRYLSGPGARRRTVQAYASALRVERAVRSALDVLAAT